MKEKNRIIVANRGWAETVPEWMFEELKAERRTIGMRKIINPDGIEDVGDVETVIYLYTESLTHPLSTERVNIYTYLAAKIMERKEKNLPDYMKEALEQELTDWEKHILAQLKHDIYTRRGKDIDTPFLRVLKELKKRSEKEKEMI